MAAVGLLMVLATAGAWVGGVTPLVFTSGSMAPAISTGDLAFGRSVDPTTLQPGDVASVVANDGSRVSHRVVAVQPRGSETVLVLRGDANRGADPSPYVVTEADQIVWHLPAVGRVLVHLDGPPAWALGGLVALGVALGVRRPGSGRHRERVRSAGPSVTTLVSGMLITVTAAVVTATPTAAYWTDDTVARSGSFTTPAGSPAPTGPTCSAAGNNVLGSWDSVGQRYRYIATLHRLDTGAQVGSAAEVDQAASATISSTFSAGSFAALGALPATGAYNFQIRVRAIPVASTTWVSSAFLTIPVHFQGVAYAVLRCGYDTSTTVEITSLGSDTGQLNTDFVTNVKTNTIKGTGEPGATIVLSGISPQPAAVTVDGAGNWSAAVTLAEGLQNVTASATDLAGNTASATRNGIRLDTVAPTVTQSAPCAAVGNPVLGVVGSTWCKVTSLALTAAFADAGSGLDTSTGRQINNDAAGFQPYTGAVSLAEKNGRVVVVRATDVAGNSAADTKTYYIDGTAPTIVVTSPGNVRYSTTVALRTAVQNACGSNRVGCGVVQDAISGPSTTVAPRWQLLRQWTYLIFGQSSYLRGDTGTYGAGATTTYATTQTAGGVFSLAVPTASTTFFPAPGLLDSASTYTLSISGATDAAGNIAAPLTHAFGD